MTRPSIRLAHLAERLFSRGLGVNRRVVVPYLPRQSIADWYELEPAAPVTEAEPIPPRQLWVGYGRTAAEYLESGRTHVHAMAEAMVACGQEQDSVLRVLDFGCAAGRMTRFIREVYSAAAVWGVDINAASIDWACRHLADRASFATTTQYPHLPFEDGTFDLVYAGSVFSHLDDLAMAWFLELRRITRPCGRLFLTVQDEETVRVVLDQAFADHWLHRFRFPPRIEALARSLAEHRTASFAYNRSAYPHVYYNSAALVASLRPHFADVQLDRGAYGYQSTLILTK